MTHMLELRGCAPEPLMTYLKALGVFRTVAEQMDKYARSWWKNDSFMLKSALDRDALVEFFLKDYRPTPIVSPWNGGSGFFSRDNSKAMDTILKLESPRFRLWGEVVSTGKRIVSRGEGIDKRNFKEWTLAKCRAEFPDDALDWLDATYVLTEDGATFPPLLGTGGNDGRLEFSNNFMQNVISALNLDERRDGVSLARSRLIAALFNDGSPESMRKRSTGFYNPGGVGGANASVGFNDVALTNPWDYVLMLEGVLMFAGAATRRLVSPSSPKAVFPFTADSSPAGYGTSADSEYGYSSRAEFWAPLWDRPTSSQELRHVLSEGRAQIGRRQGANGTDFARAVVGLGTESGVRQFQRHGFMARNGLAYLAAPLGRFYTPDHNASERTHLANVLFDLDSWLYSLRRNASGSSVPTGLGTVLRQIEVAILEFCQRGRPRDLQEVLIAVGRAERWVGRSVLRQSVGPLSRLSWEWTHHAYDGSAEFRLARAMASILPEPPEGNRKVGPIRENLEPVDTGGRPSWRDNSASFVWGAGDAYSNMVAVLERRCLEGRMSGTREGTSLPLNGTYSATFSDLVSLIDGRVDAQRLSDIAMPLSFATYWPRQARGDSQPHRSFSTPVDLPSAYAVMKLTLLSGKFKLPEYGVEDGIDIAMEPSMLSMLRKGRIEDAYRIACRRLRASGLRPISNDPGIRNGLEQGRRLAAALLFPLDDRSHGALAECALRKPG